MNSIYNKLINLGESDYYPFHMPGHKRRYDMMHMDNPYKIDITEIDGFDNLHEPEDILRDSMEIASKMYNSDKSYYLINGSTGGILSAISAVTNIGDEILMARNCHKAVYNAVFLRNLKSHYIYPQYNEHYGINCGILAEDIEEMLINNSKIKAVIITSPTYEGIVSDVKNIADVVHRYGIPLIVDEAHGAHFRFSKYFPVSALDLGADVVIQSLHKTMPAFTQTAIIHIKSDIVDREKLEKFLAIYQTSSPSYILMAGIDRCIQAIRYDGEQLYREYAIRLDNFYRQVQVLNNIDILCSDIKNENSVYDFDRSKILISVKGTNMSGSELYNILLNEYHLQMEMQADTYVLAMTSMYDTDEGINRLLRALIEIDSKIVKADSTIQPEILDKYRAKRAITVYEAEYEAKIEVDISRAEGKISAEYAYLYPPGIPIVVPGEVLTYEVISLLKYYKKCGLSVKGLKDCSIDRIRVIERDIR